MTITEALDYIHGLNRFGIKLGLENISRLLELIGNPHKQLQCIHIAGTNGKGSTASFIAHALMAEGYKVGRFVSPFLEVFNERIQINKSLISDSDLIFHLEKIKATIETADCDFKPTEFEVVTALGFAYFAAQKVDVVVLEVGMGGHFDSTNVIEKPLAAVLTPIAFDHQAYLGDTLAAIAYEKAGIIKSQALVVSARQEVEAMAVIADKVKEQSAQLVQATDKVQIISSDLSGTSFRYGENNYYIKMLGTYQVQNACLAIECLEALNRNKLLSVSQSAIKTGLGEATWAGRFEKLSEQPLILIDGAHNIAGIKALRDSINHYLSDFQKIAVFGVMADKEVSAMLDIILPCFDKIYIIKANNPRALGVEELAQMIRTKNTKIEVAVLTELAETARLPELRTKAKNAIIGFGSLYLVGDLRKNWLKKNN